MACRDLQQASCRRATAVHSKTTYEPIHPVAFAWRARYLHHNNNDRSDPEGRQSGEALLVPQATATLYVAVRDGAYGHGRAPDATEHVAMKNFAGCGMPVPPALP